MKNKHKHSPIYLRVPMLLSLLILCTALACRSWTGIETPAPPSTPGKVEVMGYIKDLDKQGESLTILFDRAEWFDGPEAEKAIIEDGLCADPKHGCEPPNGFYIRNLDEDTIAYQVSEQVVIVMQTLSHKPDGSYNSDERIDINRFRQAFRCACTSHLRLIPYWITVDNGVVMTIKEQYVP